MTSPFASYPSLKGRVVFVTGGASGIGADVVRAFHGQGAKVAFVDIHEPDGTKLAAGLADALFLPCDLTRIDDLKAAIGAARTKLGPIAVLVNNAANDDRRAIAEIDEAYWDWSQDVNLKHHFFAAQAVLPQMKELGFGSIVNFSSIAWRFGADQMAAYVTAKSAVLGLTRVLARNFGPFNIRVNSIEPGAVMTEKQLKLWYPKREQVDAMVERQAIRRMLTGDEIARTVLFLASDDSRMITKQSLIVDAGLA
jgi:NAD(P)-dependent dehydrogenase (short-subunit alcohol dehydrogenase family)